MIIQNDLIVFDLETTGTWVDKDKILEIAMIKCLVSGKQETYYKRVNPGIPIPPPISDLLKINDSDLKNAPSFRDIGGEILTFIGNSDFAGFNIQRFDLPLLARELNEAGYKFEWQKHKIYDVQKIFHLHEKRDLFSAYRFYCQKELTQAHNALADSQAALEILQAQIQKYGTAGDNLSALDKFDYESSNEFYDKEHRFRWWNGKLYMMFGKYAKRYSLEEIVRRDKKYLEWILSANFGSEVKTLISDALNGRFPMANETPDNSK